MLAPTLRPPLCCGRSAPSNTSTSLNLGLEPHHTIFKLGLQPHHTNFNGDLLLQHTIFKLGKQPHHTNFNGGLHLLARTPSPGPHPSLR